MSDVIAILFLLFVICVPNYALREFKEWWHERARPKTDDERFLDSVHVKGDWK